MMIYAIKNKDEHGAYIDVAAARWDVMFAANPYTPSLWAQFESEDECLAAWGLTYDPLPPLQASVSAEATPRQDSVASPLPDDALPETEG